MPSSNILNSIIARSWSKFISSDSFFLPVLGPVHSSRHKIYKLLLAVLNNIDAKDFLAYDKNKRWFNTKQECIIKDSIKVTDHGIFLAARDIFFNSIKIYYYSLAAPDRNVLIEAGKLAKKFGKKGQTVKFHCFHEPKFRNKVKLYNVYLKRILRIDRAEERPAGILLYNELDLEIRKTFARLVKDGEHDGLRFLWTGYLRKNKNTGPVLCAVHEGAIIGAIGPLDLSRDVWETKFLQPPYFGVLEGYKKMGYGTKLWCSAMSHAYRKGAKYTLVQNTPGKPAALFYEGQGLKICHKIFTCPINLY